MTEREKISAKINILKSKLSSSVSNVGDWKIIKCYEARMKGEEDPYDFEALTAERQKIRDKINTLQEQLKALPVEDTTTTEQ
jgi:uncharacterized protein YPO0396